jgi:hypothetical protein
MTYRKFRASLGVAMMVLLVGIGTSAPASAQRGEGGAHIARPSPIDPSLTPGPGQDRASNGLAAEKLDAYRDRLESRMESDRMSGRDLTPGGGREMRNLGNALDNVQGAVGR